MIEKLEHNKQLILFDGVCNLCNSSVQFVIKRDKKDKFRYAALQSEIGQEIIEKFKIDTSKTDSIILYSNNKGISYKSTAALKIASKLGFPTNILTVFFIIPAIIRNVVYDYIAKNRYKWYGKKDHCMIPTPELKSKFLQ
jgi:predicted DCC family thiol-disulfide oxidoreductase YuxK